MQTFEKLGLFFLGKIFDPDRRALTDELLLYDSKDLTTHAVCVGMTGSGKTGLGITILEEAALDKIPAIIIDPKGDLGNLLLIFPHFSAEEFQPWVDPAAAEREGLTLNAYAQKVAKQWQEGLAKWGENSQRIQNLKNAVEMVIYTPASQAGIPLSILSSFAAPPKEQTLDTTAMRERVMAFTSSLLGLLGIAADPIKSREHILISSIVAQAWRNGNDLDIASIIQQIQKPPFSKIGALDVDTFFPPKERMSLAITLNNLLASPGFHAWMEGDPLDIQQLLYTHEGKPKLSIISIAHLSDTERMFFVTLLLNQLLVWMRGQSGTSSLRSLLYMDEIFGYFPPTAMPPSKIPMLTLLKQARAFGLGVILATQNPVDLDYKGLANCGTWFIGKLQTERDKARVIEGLNVASNGEITSQQLEKMIASTGKRIFIMRSIHQKEPVLFETRWTLSYLRGPLTLPQIETLTDHSSQARPKIISTDKAGKLASKPAISPGIEEFFVNQASISSPHYQPMVAGFAKLHFVDTKLKIDTWEEMELVAPSTDDGKEAHWDDAKNYPEIRKQLKEEPLPNSTFSELPAGLMQEKNYGVFSKSLHTWLYQTQSLSVYKYPELGLISKEGENEAEFRIRVSQALRENRDETVSKLREKFEQKITVLKERVRKAQEKMVQQQKQAGWQKAETFLSMITTFIGALFGRGITKGTISKAETSMRRMGRSSKESQEAARAEDDYKASQDQLNDLQSQMHEEIERVPFVVDPSSIKIDTMTVKPRKSDISIERVALIWWAIS